MNANSKKIFYFLSAVLVIFWILRILNGNYRLIDSDVYVWTAEMIQNGSYFVATTDIDTAWMLTMRPFVYPLFILFTGIPDDAILIGIQSIIGILNLYLCIRLFEKLGGKISQYMLAALIVFTPAIFIYTHLVMSEVLIMTLILWLALILTSTLTTKKIICVQLILIVLFFTKPVFYPFAFVNAIFWLVYLWKYKKMIALSAIIPLLCIYGYMRFNEYRTGYFHFSSIQTINLIHYNGLYYDISQYGYERAHARKDSLLQVSYTKPTFKERNEFLNKAGSEHIKEHILSYGLFHCTGAIRGMFDPGRYDLSTFFTTSGESNGMLSTLNNKGVMAAIQKMIAVYSLWLIVLLAGIMIAAILKYIFIGYYFCRHYKYLSTGMMLLILFILYTIFITGPINASRFMMPLQLVLIAVAAMGWEEWKRRVK